MRAGSARLPGNVAGLFGDDDLPCADLNLLLPLKQSQEYAGVRKRLAERKPVDAWQMNGLHYFVFECAATVGGESPPWAFTIFTMSWEDDGPRSALLITPSEAGVCVADLKHPELVTEVPLPPAVDTAAVSSTRESAVAHPRKCR